MLEVVERELRVASRSRGIFASRAVAAGIPLAILLYYHLVMQSFYGRMSGSGLFNTLMYLALFAVSFGGLRSTSDSITSEKREGTLGLLFLTALSATDVIAGKFAAYGLRSFYSLIATLPMIALSLLLGGVTGGEFLCGSLLLLNTLFFSLALGLVCSTFFKRQNAALGVASALMMVLMLAGFLVQAALEWWQIRPPDVVVHLFSPLMAFAKISNSFMGADPQFFWIHVGFLQALGWLCLLLAKRGVRECWKEVVVANTFTRMNWLNWRSWPSLLVESSQSLAAYRNRALSHSPYYWRVTRSKILRMLPWSSVILAVLAICCGFVFDSGFVRQGGFAVFVLVILHLVFRVMLAASAAFVMVEDRLSGGLELALGTPLTVKRLLHGYYWGIWRNFGGPLATIILLELAIFSWVAFIEADLDKEMVRMMICFCLNLVVDCLAIVPLTLWKAIDLNKPQHAAGIAGLRILVVPGVLFVLLVSLAHPDGDSVAIIWVFINFFNALLNGGISDRKLRDHLRERVASRFTAKIPLV